MDSKLVEAVKAIEVETGLQVTLSPPDDPDDFLQRQRWGMDQVDLTNHLIRLLKRVSGMNVDLWTERPSDQPYQQTDKFHHLEGLVGHVNRYMMGRYREWELIAIVIDRDGRFCGILKRSDDAAQSGTDERDTGSDGG